MPTRTAADGAATGASAARAPIDCHGLSHAGRVRPNNEDHFAIVALQRGVRVLHTNLEDAQAVERLARPAAHVFIVADGVAGSRGGEEASGLAVGSIVQYLGEAAHCYDAADPASEQGFIDTLSAGVERAHRSLVERHGPRHGPSTTLTMVTLVGPRAYVVHVGDSRGYLLRGGRLRQFTKDQTMGDLFVDIGRGTAEQASERGLYDILTSAVGSDMAPAVGVVDVEAGDTLLLCTDGLTKHAPDERIAALLASAASADAACRALVEEALAQGGSDNVTVVVARFAPGAAEP